MEHFSKTEIAWIISELEAKAHMLRYTAESNDGSVIPGLSILRAEQYESIVRRLRTALEKDNKRIEITY